MTDPNDDLARRLEEEFVDEEEDDEDDDVFAPLRRVVSG